MTTAFALRRFERALANVTFAVSALLLVSCQSGEDPGSPAQPAAVAAPVNAKVPPVAVAPATVVPAAAPAEPAAAPAAPSNAVQWHGDVDWHTWSDAVPLATKQSKPIMVLVYADWCPHCRALGPVFADPEIEALSKRFVMVRQNNDDDAAWLQPYNQKYGGYVPRIFFFDSSGKMREELTSGHPRYPYFYAAEQPEFLKNTMRRAIGS